MRKNGKGNGETRHRNENKNLLFDGDNAQIYNLSIFLTMILFTDVKFFKTSHVNNFVPYFSISRMDSIVQG